MPLSGSGWPCNAIRLARCAATQPLHLPLNPVCGCGGTCVTPVRNTCPCLAPTRQSSFVGVRMCCTALHSSCPHGSHVPAPTPPPRQSSFVGVRMCCTALHSSCPHGSHVPAPTPPPRQSSFVGVRMCCTALHSSCPHGSHVPAPTPPPLPFRGAHSAKRSIPATTHAPARLIKQRLPLDSLGRHSKGFRGPGCAVQDAGRGRVQP